MAPASNPQRFYLLTYPRTASNLLVKMLALDKQPNLSPGEYNGGYFFYPAMMLMVQLGVTRRPIQEWTADERTQVRDCYQNCFDKLQAHLDDAEAQGHSVFVKEHVTFFADPVVHDRHAFGSECSEDPWLVQIPSQIYGSAGATTTRSSQNMTVLPDAFLRTWRPTFLIRHPALAFPSFIRALLKTGTPDEASSGKNLERINLFWTRMLFDWYRRDSESINNGDNDDESNVKWPLVLDADDIIAQPEVVKRFARILGMDTSQLAFTWQAETEENLADSNKSFHPFRSTLDASKGIVKSKVSDGVDIDAEAAKWKEEFGADPGARLETAVRAAMPDYEYLKSHRLTVS